GSKLKRASKLEVKGVDDVWDTESHTWKFVDISEQPETADDLDEYILVDHRRVGKDMRTPTYYIEIKSLALQGILRTVLQDVKGISLNEDKLQVERNILYSYLNELEESRNTITSDIASLHLNVLTEYLERTYRAITERLSTLLKAGEITYDLLPFLFRPNITVYTISRGSKKPMCFGYTFGQERTMQAAEYFYVEGRCLDSDGKVFGEGMITAMIYKFRGPKPVRALEVYPLKYHKNEEGTRASLIARGRRFVALTGVCFDHCYYNGIAFEIRSGNPVSVSINSRIIIDASSFLEANPNYIRSSITNEDCNELKEDDFLRCFPTVLGFSLSDGLWLEFSIDDITNIDWNPFLMDHLVIDDKHKRLIRALTNFHMSRASDHSFDDFTVGKGQGLIILFYGPPGVGKTMTVEAISEQLQTPLYIISAAKLDNNPQRLEQELSTVLRLANQWKAIVLLEEVDIFLQKRNHNRDHLSLTSVFLRKLKYYQGTIILTARQVENLDEAIGSGIHLTIKYQPLGLKTRKRIWRNFLEKATTAYGDAQYRTKDLDSLGEYELNGHQIKNAVNIVHAIATEERAPVSYHHIETVIDTSKEF
ncbi:P-loop containing nucleoside triphosphate hydrolase protein, partial [Xylogone sp. PMI_703]